LASKHKANRAFRSSFPEEVSHFRTRAWIGGVPRRPEELKPYFGTILHAFCSAARTDPTVGITLVDADGAEKTISYLELYHMALKMSRGLSRLGVKRGDRVLIVLPTCLEFVAVFFAVQMLGAIPVPTYPPSGLRIEAGLDRLTHIAEHAQVRVCVTDPIIHPFLGQLMERVRTLDHMALVGELQVEGKREKMRAFAKDPAFIQYTSGSTDRPKGVLLTHRNLVCNIHAIGQALKITRKDVTVSWLPLYHDMGLIGTLLFSIYWRVPLVLMSPTTFLMKPSRWLWAIHKHKGTLSPAPNFAYALCVRRVKAEERQGLDLSSWRLAMNGAEPVDHRTVVSFLEMYKPHGFPAPSMLPVYGLAEASLAVTFPELGKDPKCLLVDRAQLANGRVVDASGKGSMAVVSVGKPVPGHEVLVVDEHGKKLPAREVGHVIVRGPSLMEGYFESPETTSRVMRQGWLWTGDLGFFDHDELYVTGRVKDMIILRGRNIYAEDLERVAERVDHVRPGGSLAFGVYDEIKATEKVVLVVETRVAGAEERAALIRSIIERVAEFTDVRLDEVVLVGPRTLPKTSSGKKQRNLCRTMYLQDELRSASISRLGVAKIYVRSRAGYMVAAAKKLLRG
jgi:acyl-CoA synthetase (AMP-forming)/AMP-acid ligase II